LKSQNVAENSRFEKLNNVEFFWIFEATNYCLILLIQRAFINGILGLQTYKFLEELATSTGLSSPLGGSSR